MKSQKTAIIFSIAIVLAALFVSYAYMNRNKWEGSISVTGLGKADFTSDLIVWEASYSVEDRNLSNAYKNLNRQKQIILDFLHEKQLDPDEIVFRAVSTHENTEPKYIDGKLVGYDFVGYSMTQTVEVKSSEVEKIEKVSREITELLNQGVQVYSNAPRYFYTKLEDLKIEMISKATENAHLRAKTIATNAGAELGKLTYSKMGIFQITGQYSEEDHSWGGAFNTGSKEKTASITMKLNYSVKK